MRHILKCINPTLKQICKTAIEHEGLGDKVRQLLPDELREHVQVASFEKGKLVLMVDNAHWATSLRFILPQLRNQLRNHGLFQLITIEMNIKMG